VAVDDTGDWGQPNFLALGAPEVDIDPSAVADYFAAITARRFANWAALVAAGAPPADGHMARVDTIRGAYFIYAGGWVMYGTARFADAAARNAAITSPVLGMRAVLTSDEITYLYDGSAWLPWEKGLTAWTPALQNFNALGTSGAAVGSISVAGGWCDWWMKVNFGAGVAAPSTGWGFTLPIPLRVALDDWNQRIGDGLLRDASVLSSSTAGANVDLAVIFDGASGYASFRQPYSGSAGVTDYGYLAATLTGVPTLASGDYLTARGRFPV
jgi:hypothetical protein